MWEGLAGGKRTLVGGFRVGSPSPDEINLVFLQIFQKFFRIWEKKDEDDVWVCLSIANHTYCHLKIIKEYI